MSDKRFALIVGISRYESDRAGELPSAVIDAQRMRSLLTSSEGFSFPENNVCMLLDEQATRANFLEAFETSLIQRIPQDATVAIYYSGHGTQVIDRNGDESDGKDEALVLHDSLTNGVPPLLDDELHALLARLHQRTRDITLIFDSCHSGTAARGSPTATRKTFVLEGDAESPGPAIPPDPELEPDGEGFAQPLDGMVIVSAAMDGTPAWEPSGGGGGYFTTALVEILGQSAPLTWRQAASRVQEWIRKRKPVQVPQVYGDTDRLVFGQAYRRRPLSWTIVSLEEGVWLSGPPMPGVEVGAEFRLYDGNLAGVDYSNPALGKTRVRLETFNGLMGRGAIIGAPNEKLAVGDIGILIRPSLKSRALTVGFAAPHTPLLARMQTELRQKLTMDSSLAELINIQREDYDFELASPDDSTLVLRDREQVIRNRFVLGSDRLSETLLATLAKHARQRTLLELRGEGGGRFHDEETLKLSLEGAEHLQHRDCSAPRLHTEPTSGLQLVNNGSCWRIRVESKAKVPLGLGIVVLSSDGEIAAFPPDGTPVVIDDESMVLPIPLIAKPPLQAVERVLVFGTPPDNPVPWHLLGLPGVDALSALTETEVSGRGDASRSVWTVSSLSWAVSSN